MKVVVSEKGQVTIPKRLRDRLGLRPGTVIEFEEASGQLVGRKLVPQGRLAELVGIITLPGTVDEAIRDLRGPGPARTRRSLQGARARDDHGRRQQRPA